MAESEPDTDAESSTDTEYPEPSSPKYRSLADVLTEALRFEDRMVQKQYKIDLNPTIIEHLGIDGRLIDVTIHTDDESIEINDVVIGDGDRYKFTIPKNRRTAYGIEYGESVDVEIRRVHTRGIEQ